MREASGSRALVPLRAAAQLERLTMSASRSTARSAPQNTSSTSTAPKISCISASGRGSSDSSGSVTRHTASVHSSVSGPENRRSSMSSASVRVRATSGPTMRRVMRPSAQPANHANASQPGSASHCQYARPPQPVRSSGSGKLSISQRSCSDSYHASTFCTVLRENTQRGVPRLRRCSSTSTASASSPLSGTISPMRSTVRGRPSATSPSGLPDSSSGLIEADRDSTACSRRASSGP